MSFGRYDHQHPKHRHQKHHQQQQPNPYGRWDAQSDYTNQAYVTVQEQMPYGQEHNHHHPNFRAVSDDYYYKGEGFPDTERRVRVTEYETTTERVARDNGSPNDYAENVDAEAEQFIKLEHKKFGVRNYYSQAD